MVSTSVLFILFSVFITAHGEKENIRPKLSELNDTVKHVKIIVIVGIIIISALAIGGLIFVQKSLSKHMSNSDRTTRGNIDRYGDLLEALAGAK